MGLGPLAGSTWGSVVTVLGTVALFLAAVIGAGYIALWMVGVIVGVVG